MSWLFRLRMVSPIEFMISDVTAQSVARVKVLAQFPPGVPSRTEALHIAIVAHHRIQYLLTWNFRPIANAMILPRIREVLTDLIIPIPVICTPRRC